MKNLVYLFISIFTVSLGFAQVSLDSTSTSVDQQVESESSSTLSGTSAPVNNTTHLTYGASSSAADYTITADWDSAHVLVLTCTLKRWQDVPRHKCVLN